MQIAEKFVCLLTRLAARLDHAITSLKAFRRYGLIVIGMTENPGWAQQKCDYSLIT